ncbi:MAG: ABC transporter permease [Propionibacteriales bacterium]|nr:ABC transporter permease [Propionibacteriales bacterium]
MNALLAELIKLKRSLSWPVVVLLPLALVVSAVVNTLVSGQPLEDGWATLWLRSLVFGGLFPLALGVGTLASLVWRVEHRGNNWNVLMSGPTPTWRIVVAKGIVVAGLSAAMQVLLHLAVLVMGEVLGLPGGMPVAYLGISALIMIACVPLAVLQSGLSMVLRSFAAPIAVALVGSGISIMLLMAGLDAALVSPYGLFSRTTQLGTGTFLDDGSTSAIDVVMILSLSVGLTAGLLAATTWFINRRDTHA